MTNKILSFSFFLYAIIGVIEISKAEQPTKIPVEIENKNIVSSSDDEGYVVMGRIIEQGDDEESVFCVDPYPTAGSKKVGGDCYVWLNDLINSKVRFTTKKVGAFPEKPCQVNGTLQNKSITKIFIQIEQLSANGSTDNLAQKCTVTPIVE